MSSYIRGYSPERMLLIFFFLHTVEHIQFGNLLLFPPSINCIRNISHAVKNSGKCIFKGRVIFHGLYTLAGSLLVDI